MKKLLLSFLFLFYTSSFALEYLAIVDNLTQAEDFYCIDRMGDKYLIIANQQELASLKKRQYTCKVFDENPRNNIYYLLFPKNVPTPEITALSTILETFYIPSDIEIYRISMLVRVTEQNRKHLFNLDVDLNLIEFDKMNCTPPIPPRTGYQNSRAAFNPLIQELVDLVSEDTLRSFVRYLSDSISTRSAKKKGNAEESVPWIANKFREYGCDSVYIQAVPDYEYAPNPVGIRLGKTYPSYSRYFVMGGHCDAVPHEDVNKGADDNATGISAAIEAARVMSNYNFNYTIVYMGFNAEEVGLLGSAEFAAQAEERGDTILGTLTHDMLGRTTSDRDYLRIVYRSNITGGSEMGNLYDQAAKTYTNLKYDLSPNTSGSEWSDQAPFWKEGYNAICCIESAYGTNEVNHTIDDTLDAPDGLNDTEFLTECTKASVATLAMDTLGGWTGASLIEPNTNNKISSDINQNKSSLSVVMQGTHVLIKVAGLDSQDPVDICIYNACGKQIKTIPVNNRDAQSTVVVWDSNKSTGNRIAKGVYFVQLLKEGKGSVTRKFFYMP